MAWVSGRSSVSWVGNFFSKSSRRVPCLFMTAMWTVSIKADFESIIGLTVDFDHWPAAIKMMHQKVALHFWYTIQPALTMTKMINPELQEDTLLPNQVIVYSNTRTRIVSFKDTLCNYLDGDDALWEKDLLLLVGTCLNNRKLSTLKCT